LKDGKIISSDSYHGLLQSSTEFRSMARV
jgi:hypothetical protein